MVNTTRDDINLHLFEWLFPWKYFEEVILVETNKFLNQQPVTYGELLHWIGLWVLISMVDGSNHHLFWSSKSANLYEGSPFWFSEYMSHTQFEEIMSLICYTDESPLALLDHSWGIQCLIVAWNKNMDENFIPSWINAIDESISKCLNEYTSPGFMFVPCKPWKFGNEYHDTGCGLSNITWQVDLCEGKDCPAHLGKKKFNDLGSTIGTLLHFSKPVHGTGKIFILDSGFCVFQSLIKLKKRGCFAHALIMKWRYWPKHILGKEIITHFTDKEIGDADAISRILDEVLFYVIGLKEPDYLMKIMTTYGTMKQLGDQKL